MSITQSALGSRNFFRVILGPKDLFFNHGADNVADHDVAGSPPWFAGLSLGDGLGLCIFCGFRHSADGDVTAGCLDWGAGYKKFPNIP